jgi:hypothetical protein
MNILAYTYSPMIISFSEKKKKIDQETFHEMTSTTLNFTLDHRYLDGALAAKISGDVNFIYKNFKLDHENY